MKYRVMTIDEVRAESDYFQETQDYSVGICALVDVENMGFCKDGRTKWYTFYDVNGKPAIYFNH